MKVEDFEMLLWQYNLLLRIVIEGKEGKESFFPSLVKKRQEVS